MNLRIHFARPMFSEAERRAVEFVLQRRKLTCGGQVAAFEEQFEAFVGGGKAVAVSSCMAALHLSYLVQGVGPGDEVVVPALTHIAGLHAVELVGARPRFVDCHPESGNLDPELLEAVLSSRTKAISIVHFLARPGYMRSILSIARGADIPVIEDCALALGTRHWDTHVGLIGNIGCFSFYPCKHITTGEGGIFLTRYPELAEKARRARSFGIDEHGEVVELGLNYRMTEMQAALGLEQLKKLPQFLKVRARNAALLRALLSSYEVIGGDYALSVLVPAGWDRDAVRHRMLQMRIETSVYYKRPVCDFPYYRKYGPVDCPNARRICERSITLPVGPHLRTPDIRLLAESFEEALEDTKA